MNNGAVFKTCNCTEPVTRPDGTITRRELGTKCPQLRRPDGELNSRHGSWMFQIQIAGTRATTRSHLRREGYATRAAAEKALDQVKDLLAVADGAEEPVGVRSAIAELIRPALKARTPLPDPDYIRGLIGRSLPVETDPFLNDYLAEWVENRKKLRPNTLRSYRQQVRDLAPYFEGVKLRQLTLDVAQQAFNQLHEDQLVIADENETRRFLVDYAKQAWREHRGYDARRARALLKEWPPFRQVKGPASIERYLACLRSALTMARRKYPLPENVAALVELPEVHRHTPLLWTEERVEAWRETGKVPSAVMVWTEEHVKTFLACAKDSACGYPYAYYAAFKTIALLGTRRGETLALPTANISYQTGAILIAQQLVQYGWETEIQDNTKTPDGKRTAIAPKTLLTTLAKNREIQKAQRQAAKQAGEEWTDSGLAFADDRGRPIHPAKLTDALRDIAKQCDLPPVRVHDLRHGVVTYARAEGVEDSVISAAVGHANKWITNRYYGDIANEAKQAASEKLATRFALNDEDD
jgi:integrase